MSILPRITLSLYIKLLAVALLIVVARFTFLHSKTIEKSDKCNLELIVSDFNRNEVTNAKVYVYESLHAYEEDSPLNISNWEQRGNHYRFIGLPPKEYYFRVVSSSLDNSSDVYSTSKRIDSGANYECMVTIK